MKGEFEQERIYRPVRFWKYVLVIRRFSGREGTNEKHELPTLLFAQAFFEGRHGFSAFTDLVKKFAVGDGAHALGIVEARWRWIVEGGVRAVAFSCIAVALDAFIEIYGVGGGEGRWRRLEGVFALFGFLGDFPFAVLIDRDKDGDADDSEESCENDFAQAKSALRCVGHGQREIFAYPVGRQKKEKLYAEDTETQRPQKKEK
jgi:hypothetical protein